MKSVIGNENTIIIKNSKFITFLYPIQSKEEVFNFLTSIKQKYPDATHHCYAYIYDGEQKESDDGEPAGTAGLPILQVLEKNELNHVLCIVVRYFGKIKLGANGLVRAYRKSVVECLRDHMITLKKGFCVTLSFDYSFSKKIDYLLKNVFILEKRYQNKVYYHCHIDEEVFLMLKELKDVEIEIHHTLYL